ncbi:MAG: hypothetical protein ACOH2M_22440 [Cypionkella sp.]
MTIASATNKSGPYFYNGSATSFAYGFKISNEAHIRVVETVTATGVEADLVLNTDYTVTGVGADAGGNVVISPARAAGKSAVMVRNTPFTQGVVLENQGAYFAKVVEGAFDDAAARDQQLQEQISRAVVVPVSADATDLETLIGGVVSLLDNVDAVVTVAGIAGAVETVAANVVPTAIVAGNIDAVVIAADNMAVILTVPGLAADVATDAAATAADRVATAADRVVTTADRVQTGLDKVATAADRVQTGLDRVATGQDRVATAADRVQTGLDRVAAAASAASVDNGYTTTATAAGTTTLTVASAKRQYFTGTTTQTVVLPVTSTLVLGQQFRIVNNSTGKVTVQSSGANVIQVMGGTGIAFAPGAPGTELVLTCIAVTGTGVASWAFNYESPTTAWVAYTPTFNNFGTVTGISAWSRRVGDTLQIRAKFTTGTTVAAQASMGIGFNGANVNVTSDATKVPSTQLAGSGVLSINAATAVYTLIESAATAIVFSFQSGTTAGTAKLNGASFGDGTTVSVTADIPISGW